MKKMKEQNDKHPVGAGKMLAWQSRAISTGANMMVLGYLSMYCTDFLGISAGTIGLLLMISKLIDGVTDLLFGYIVDRTNTKIGRGRPYELCILGVWLCTWLMFSCPPSFSTVFKCVWVVLMYSLVTSIFTTFLNASQTVYMVRAFKYREQYVAISSYGAVVAMVFTVIVNISLPILVGKIATTTQGWSVLMLIYSVPLAIIGIMRFIFIKETNPIDAKSEKVQFKDVLLVLKTNKYIYIVAFITLVATFVSNMGIYQYYFKYVVGNIEIFGLVSGMQMIGMPLVFIYPKFVKKYSVTALISAGIMLMVVGNIINFIAYSSVPLLIVGFIIMGAGQVPLSMMMGLLIIDCAEYNEYKGNQRLEATLSNINGFAQKIGAAFGSGVVGVLLGMSGYVGTNDVQVPSAMTMLRVLNSLLPAVLYLILLFVMRLYKLEKQMPAIRAENEKNRVQQ